MSVSIRLQFVRTNLVSPPIVRIVAKHPSSSLEPRCELAHRQPDPTPQLSAHIARVSAHPRLDGLVLCVVSKASQTGLFLKLNLINSQFMHEKIYRWRKG